MEFIAALNEVPNKMGPRLFIYVLFLFLTLEESNPPYLSEKKPFKYVVRHRKNLIDCFL